MRTREVTRERNVSASRKKKIEEESKQVVRNRPEWAPLWETERVDASKRENDYTEKTGISGRKPDEERENEKTREGLRGIPN